MATKVSGWSCNRIDEKLYPTMYEKKTYLVGDKEFDDEMEALKYQEQVYYEIGMNRLRDYMKQHNMSSKGWYFVHEDFERSHYYSGDVDGYVIFDEMLVGTFTASRRDDGVLYFTKAEFDNYWEKYGNLEEVSSQFKKCADELHTCFEHYNGCHHRVWDMKNAHSLDLYIERILECTEIINV